MPQSADDAARALDPETRAFWERTWASLDKADRSTRRGDSWRRQMNDLTDLAVERRIVGLSRADEQDLFRTRLLQWHLDRIEGRRARPVDPPRAPMAWLAGEPWLAARALPAGATRSAAMLLALDETGAIDRPARVALADQQVREELAVADAAGAASLAERVDELEPNPARLALRAWSMAQAGRSDDPGAAWRARVAAAVEGPDPASARVALARLALASGNELSAREHLGAALALSSPEAASLTARLLVARGEPRRARVLARAWIDDGRARDVPAALWALACLAETPGPDAQGAPPRPAAPVR